MPESTTTKPRCSAFHIAFFVNIVIAGFHSYAGI